jgi:hypothetical protein
MHVKGVYSSNQTVNPDDGGRTFFGTPTNFYQTTRRDIPKMLRETKRKNHEKFGPEYLVFGPKSPQNRNELLFFSLKKKQKTIWAHTKDFIIQAS